jgi:hypothetical protein
MVKSPDRAPSSPTPLSFLPVAVGGMTGILLGGVSWRLRAFPSSGRTGLCHASGSRRLSLPHLFAIARAWKHGARAGVEAFSFGLEILHCLVGNYVWAFDSAGARHSPSACHELGGRPRCQGFSRFARNSYSERPVCSMAWRCNMCRRRQPCFRFLKGFVWQV